MIASATFGDGTRPPPCGYDTELYIAPKCGISDTPTYGLGINDAGVVVGYQWGCPNATHERGFVWWPDGTVQVILPPWGNSVRAIDINNHNQVLLLIRSQNPAKAFVPAIWENGQIVAVFELPEWANDSNVFSINDDGVILGEYGHTVTGPYPLLATWSVKDGMTDLSGFMEEARLRPAAMNNAGAIAGHTLPNTAPPPGEDHKRAFLLAEGVLTDLEKIPTGVNSFARAISEAGHVVGYGYTIVLGEPYPPNPWNAFMWYQGAMEILPPLPLLAHNHTEAWCVNSWGLTGGQSKAVVPIGEPRAPPRAVLWYQGKPYDLTDLANTNAGTKVNYPYRISDGGIITASAFKSTGRAARLWPRPPLVGDIDDTCTVDGHDLALLLQAWGNADASGLTKIADLDGDGIVDSADLGLLLASWTG